MAFDFKKECKDLYQPKMIPGIVTVPEMKFIAVSGHGDPNTGNGSFSDAVEQLYGVAYTIKMSKKSGHHIEGYVDYVVPPLEGFWRQEGTERVDGFDSSHKDMFVWTAMIRLPDFVTAADMQWAKDTAANKKKRDYSAVEFRTVNEGLCVQAMHIGPYDSEPATVAAMDAFLAQEGYMNDFTDKRLHHEIYLNDPRRTAPDKLKTVIRHPVRKIVE